MQARQLLPTCLFLAAICETAVAQPAASDNPAVWYPFYDGRSWGYIDAKGSWAVPPRFDHQLGAFEGRRARAFKDGKWGLIDRSGEWIVPPICTDIDWRPTPDEPRVLTVGARKGILGQEGRIVLEIKYDDIVLSRDRAWVRSGNKLGVGLGSLFRRARSRVEKCR